MTTGNLRLAKWLPRDLPLAGDTVAVAQPDPLETEFVTADFPEAPIDGKQYGRKNEGWTLVPPLPFANDAPSDGNRYGRRNAAWDIVPNPPPDAPSDGKDYARRNGAWFNLDPYATEAEMAAAIAAGIATTLPDAPSDGKDYARRNAVWVNLDAYATDAELAASIAANTIPDAPNDGNQYARKNKSWVEVAASSVWIGDVPPADKAKYPLWFDSVNLRLFIWFNDGTSSQWVDTNADPDELIGTFVNKAGDSMTGPLLHPDGTVAAPAITFTSETGLGLHRTAAGQIGMAAGGADRFLFDVTGSNLFINSAAGQWAQVVLNKAASTLANTVQGKTNNSTRWVMYLGDGSAESGGSAGSNFGLSAFNDAGAYIVTPLSIGRSNGKATFSTGIDTIDANPSFFGGSVVFGYRVPGAWGASNSGMSAEVNGNEQSFYLSRGANAAGPYTRIMVDAGSNQFRVVTQSTTRSIWFSDGGYQHNHNYAAKPGGGAWADSNSDERVKTAIVDFADYEFIDQIRPRYYEYKPGTGYEGTRYLGAIYQEAPPIMQTKARDTKLGEFEFEDMGSIDQTPIIWGLVNYVKKLRDRIAVLEGAAA